MSKSLNNYVGIEDAPSDMFGKLMSISDDLMWRYIELLSFQSIAQMSAWKNEVNDGRNPRDIKVLFAQEIVSRFHDKQSAEAALADFELKFQRGGIPDDVEEFTFDAQDGTFPVVVALKQSGLVSSSSEAIRAIQQGGVRVNGEKISDRNAAIDSGESVILQHGKRKFAKIFVK
jgi:tyrosyl-tRNA synthetase